MSIADNFLIQAIDDGYADTKSIAEGGEEKITPSYATKWRPLYDTGMMNKKGPLSRIEVEVEGKKYLVGESALKQDKKIQWNGAEDKHSDGTFDILLKTHLGLINKERLSVSKLVMALPVKESLDPDRVSKIKSLVLGSHDFKIKLNGDKDFNRKIISVEDIMVKNQPHGTLMNLILDDRGRFTNKDLARGFIAISDIGGKTHNQYAVEALEPIADYCDTKSSGMYTAYLWVKEYIETELGLHVTDGQMPRIINEKSIKGYDLTYVIEASYRQLAHQIIKEVYTLWDSALPFIDTMVFTGGGAELLKKYLIEEFPKSLYLNQVSNLRGLLKNGVREWGGR